MAGWFAILNGAQSDYRLDRRIDSFSRRFSVAGVPALTIRPVYVSQDLAAYTWSWGDLPHRDIHLYRDESVFLLLAGVATGLQKRAGGLLDLEGIAAAFRRERHSVPGRLNGSFSVLCCDLAARKQSVSVDRFASRSVCYAKDGDVVLVGNFPGVLASLMSRTPDLSEAGLWALVNYGRRAGACGFFEGIRHLLAGEVLDIEADGSLEHRTWWSRRYEPEEGLSSWEWGERISEALRRSAALYLNTVQNPKLFLSGGLDSRLALAALGRGVDTITFGTRHDIESTIARVASRMVGGQHEQMAASAEWPLDTRDAVALLSCGEYVTSHAHFVPPAVQIQARSGPAEFFVGDLLENLSKHYSKRISCSETNPEVVFRSDLPRITCEASAGWCFTKQYRVHAESAYYAANEVVESKAMAASRDPNDWRDTFLRWAGVDLTWTYGMISSLWPIAAERNLYFDNDLDELSLRIPSKMRASNVLHGRTLWRLDRRLALLPNNNTVVSPLVPRVFEKPFRAAKPVLSRAGLMSPSPWPNIRREMTTDRRYQDWVRASIEAVIAHDPEMFDASAVRCVYQEFQKDDLKASWQRYRGTRNLAAEIFALVNVGDVLRLFPKQA